MEGLSHLLHFKQDSMARKVLRQKKNISGLDPPRNSLDLAIETSQSYPAVGDNIPDSYEIRHDWSGNYFPNQSSMKKLINEEISTVPNTKRNAPSVVARLMGMDMLPAETPCEKRNIKPGANLSKEQKIKDSGSHVRGFSSSSSQITFDSYQHLKDRDSSPQHVSGKSRKFKHREHPQEEELQKFKKEFEAWQTARFLECSKVVELERNSTQWLAQETLNKEKIALYSNSRRLAAVKKPIERTGQVATESSREGSEVSHQECDKDTASSEHTESHSSKVSYPSKDLKRATQIKSAPKMDISSAPTRIVILRPGPERISDSEESWVNSSSTSEERGSMEDFLEEVKERLRRELQGKSKGGTMVRGCGIETPYSEKPSDPKQIAQQIAKQVRESVTRDLGMNLLRSESTRSYRNEIQYNGPTSPEFINRGTRRLLTERLTNVLKGSPDLPKSATESSNIAMLDNGRNRQSFSNMNGGGNMSYWDILDDESVQSGSFRHGPDDELMHPKDLSPRNLIRSLSAPVSGTSFGKLLLEDRHVMTGAHIRRKHEVVGSVALEVTKRKKDRFNFKEKVSSIRYSFMLKGRLFGRKFQSAEQPRQYEHYSRKDITSGPTVVMNTGETHDNSTEVPPSPASVCSSVHDEFWRGTGYLSPTSTSDISQLEDTAMPRVFREISSNLNELRRQLNALDAGGFEETSIKDQRWSEEAEMELDDEAEAYVRDLLVASGLYEGSSDKVLSRWDPLAKPISNTVFDEAEEARSRATSKEDNNEDPKRDQHREMLDRRLLLDLCNEALSTILGPPVTMSRFIKKALGPTSRPPPRGKKLLKCVWERVRVHLYPSADENYHSLDGMMARDLGSAPWFGLVNDEIDALGKEIEYQIIGDLVDEIVKDIQLIVSAEAPEIYINM